jgi:7-cyano-7-deazaguanine synthase
MDSVTLLAKVISEVGKENVQAVGFSYSSKHNRYEHEAAWKVTAHYGVSYRLIDLSGVMDGFKSNLLQSGGPIPEGHYEAESMRQTVVPGRNTIFTAILAGLAESSGIGAVYLGIHAGDHHIYADCRPEWFYSMRDVVRDSSDGKVHLRAPYLFMNKSAIIKEGLALAVPYQLTRTCYKAQPIACGRCGSCRERLGAFKDNGVADPIEYEYRHPDPHAKEESARA